MGEARKEERGRGETHESESLGADGGHPEHRVERAVDVRHELLVLVAEQRAQHTQHTTRVRNTRALSCTIHTSNHMRTKDEYEFEYNTSVKKSIIKSCSHRRAVVGAWGGLSPPNFF